MKKRTAEEWSETLAELTARRVAQEGIIASNANRRKKHAFAASQGNEASAATLERVKQADANARDEIPNLNFAIEEARQHLNAALAAEEEVELEDRRQFVDERAGDLIALDVKIIKTLRALAAMLDQRVAVLEEIVEEAARELGQMRVAQLRNDQNVIDAILDILSAHLGHRRAANVGAANKLITGDCAIFGKPSPVALPEPTAAEKERRRAAGLRVV